MDMKRQLWRIGIGGVLFTGILIARPRIGNAWIELGLFLAVYILLGSDVLYKALRSILRGRAFDENFLMGLATVGAFAIGEYPEGVAVIQVGELFQIRPDETGPHHLSGLFGGYAGESPQALCGAGAYGYRLYAGGRGAAPLSGWAF